MSKEAGSWIAQVEFSPLSHLEFSLLSSQVFFDHNLHQHPARFSPISSSWLSGWVWMENVRLPREGDNACLHLWLNDQKVGWWKHGLDIMMITITFQVLGSHWHSYSSGKKGSTDVGSRTLVNVTIQWWSIDGNSLVLVHCKKHWYKTSQPGFFGP